MIQLVKIILPGYAVSAPLVKACLFHKSDISRDTGVCPINVPDKSVDRFVFLKKLFVQLISSHD